MSFLRPRNLMDCRHFIYWYNCTNKVLKRCVYESTYNADYCLINKSWHIQPMAGRSDQVAGHRRHVHRRPSDRPGFPDCQPGADDGQRPFWYHSLLAVAVILFEGSSNLDYRELQGVSKAVRRVITIGAALAWVFGTLSMYYILDFPLAIS